MSFSLGSIFYVLYGKVILLNPPSLLGLLGVISIEDVFGCNMDGAKIEITYSTALI